MKNKNILQSVIFILLILIAIIWQEYSQNTVEGVYVVDIKESNSVDSLIIKPNRKYYHSISVMGKVKFYQEGNYEVFGSGITFYKYKINENDLDINDWDTPIHYSIFSTKIPYDIFNDLYYIRQ